MMDAFRTLQLTLNCWRLAEIDEDGFKLQLTVVDTPGFGDSIDNSAQCVGAFLRA